MEGKRKNNPGGMEKKLWPECTFAKIEPGKKGLHRYGEKIEREKATSKTKTRGRKSQNQPKDGKRRGQRKYARERPGSNAKTGSTQKRAKKQKDRPRSQGCRSCIEPS